MTGDRSQTLVCLLRSANERLPATAALHSYSGHQGIFMKHDHTTLRINADRLQSNFDALAHIGVTLEGGVHRPALSDDHLAARAWFLEQAQKGGLEAHVDAAGNHSAFLRCNDPSAKTVLLGSHLDSVPQGGRFDGALGVLAALEVLQTLKDADISLPVHLEAIDFTDEEGEYIGLLGSRAFTGQLNPESFHHPRGSRQIFESALTRAGLNPKTIVTAARDRSNLAAYLELHVEQGPRLYEAHLNIGVVTSIVGICSYKLTFLGKANHAGTTPMNRRCDAALGASAFTLSARDLVMNDFPQGVVNIGRMDVEPGVFNVVPRAVTVALEFRAGDIEALNLMETRLLHLASEEAEKFGLGLETEYIGKIAPFPMKSEIQDLIVKACQICQLSHIRMNSGAGHDAQSLALVCPTGMIFAPSVNGVSHSPYEFTEWEDCVNGANVLLQTVLEIAKTF